MNWLYSIALSILYIHGANANILDEVKTILVQNYIRDLSQNEIEIAAAKGILANLDFYSEYINKKLSDESSDGGIGVVIGVINSYPTILKVYEGTPAFEAGLLKNDIISEVNDIKLKNTTLDVIKGVLGGKIGSLVKLNILRQNIQIQLSLRRIKLKIPSIEIKNIKNIAYVRLHNFTKDSAERFQNEYKKYNNLKGIIIDLRFNPGGLLDESIAMASLFLEKKAKIVTLKSKIQSQIFISNSHDITDKLPMVLIINSESASGSELFTAALQDHKRALVIGTQSFGKGSVQNTFKLSNGDLLKITTALYYTPNDSTIQDYGIIPDIIVEDKQQNQQSYRYNVICNEKLDLQLMYAINLLKDQY